MNNPDIKFYSWSDLPIGYRSFAPYLKGFFDNGNQVPLIMVLINPSWNAQMMKRILAMFKQPPSDMADGTLNGVPIRIYFWTLKDV